MGPWLHSAWEFLSYNRYSAPGPPGCLEGKRLPGPGSCLTLQDTLVSAQGLLGMVCGMQIKTTSTSCTYPWSHINILQSYVSIKVRAWLSEITRELKSEESLVQLFKGWITLQTRYIAMQWISVNKINHAIRWIVT